MNLMNEPLERALCAYVDILGVRQRIEKASSEEESLLLHKLSATFSASSARIREAAGHFDRLKFKSFTDNLIVAYSVRVPLIDLDHLCQLLADYQLSMACDNGLFLRGGIAIGGMLIEEDMVLGKCLLKSHDLEENVAVNPRIIIDSELKEIISRDSPKLDQIWQDALGMRLLQDSDGHFFVNYLDALHEWRPPRQPCRNEDKLSKHREQVEHSLEKYRLDQPVWSKYIWVANYHNRFCDKQNQHKYRIAENLLLPKSG